MSKHTPGPWTAAVSTHTGDETDDSGNKYWEIAPENYYSGKNYLFLTGWMTEANASLIAAAPDMYEALKRVQLAARISDETGALVDAAIAKAEGR